MALSIDEWHAKLKKFVPSWYFQKAKADGGLADALFYSMAAIFQAAEADLGDQFDATFLTRALAPILDLEGADRGVDRITNESNANYVNRIQRVTSQTDYPEILAAINKILLTTPARIIEAPYINPYVHRNCFCNRDGFLSSFRNNFFIVILPPQVHAPYSFVSRGMYCARLNFSGTAQTPDNLINSVIALVNTMKAFGVLWRLYESKNYSIS